MASLKQTSNTEDGSVNYVEVPEIIKKYAEKMEMNVVQINSQRIFGPSSFVREGWEPAPGTEIFVGKIPRNYLEPELVPFLEQVGPIFQLRLMMNFSGLNKGYCYVQYFEPDQAVDAVKRLNNKMLSNKRVVLCNSVDNKRLVISGFLTSKSAEEISEAIRLIAEGVLNIEFTWDLENADPKMEKGIVFVTYDTHRAAAIARKELIASPLILWDSRITAEWAEPQTPVSPLVYVDQVLHVQNLHFKTRLKQLWKIFNKGNYAGVEAIKHFRKRQVAYIYFTSRAQAEVAKVTMDGTMLRGVEMHVSWSDSESRNITMRPHHFRKYDDQVTGSPQQSFASHNRAQMFSYEGGAGDPERNWTVDTGGLPLPNPTPVYDYQYLNEANNHFANNPSLIQLVPVEITEMGHLIQGGILLGTVYEIKYFVDEHGNLIVYSQPFPVTPVQEQAFIPI